MALTATVTKGSVTRRMPKLWSIGLVLTLTDDSGPGFVRTFAQDYKLGKALADLGAAFQAEMQQAIDIYKAERTYYDHAQLDAVVVGVQAALEV